MLDLENVSRGQQRRALLLSTVAFTVCFAVWTIFSIIGVRIKGDLGLSETAFGLLLGTPILTGSIARLFLGIWTDQFGGRRVFSLVMAAAAAATWALTSADSLLSYLLAGLVIGVAGGSFGVGVAYVSRWYPESRQGPALGIFGLGNVGAGITVFLAGHRGDLFNDAGSYRTWVKGLFDTALEIFNGPALPAGVRGVEPRPQRG